MPQHVVIAGGGFGGYYTAKTLERVVPADVRVTLVNDVNFMLYVPLLPDAAAGTLEPRHVVIPLRERLKRTELRLGWVTGGDPSANSVSVDLLDGSKVTYKYDQLVVALGSVSRTSRSRAWSSTRSGSRRSPRRSRCETGSCGTSRPPRRSTIRDGGASIWGSCS